MTPAPAKLGRPFNASEPRCVIMAGPSKAALLKLMSPDEFKIYGSVKIPVGRRREIEGAYRAMEMER